MGALPKRKRAEENGIGSREQLLEAASALMIAQQSVDISLSALAGQSGLNSALVKYYFGGKNGMLLALMKRDAANALAQIEHLASTTLSPTAKIKLHIAGIVNTYHRVPYWNRLVHYLLQDSESEQSREIVDFFIRPLIDFQRKVLDEGVATGEFVSVDPMNFYFSVLGACDSPFFAHYVFELFDSDNDDAWRKSYINYVTDMVMRMISTEKAA
jgi:TetR/AcrR family transcriptional regulator